MSIAPKALVLKKEDGEFVMVAIPADKELDLDKVAEVVGSKVNLATAEDLMNNFGLKVGAVPPFGKLLNIRMYLDKSFWSKDEVAFNAGRRDRSIKMKAQDLIKAADPDSISKDTPFC